jgi:hypothetical protein
VHFRHELVGDMSARLRSVPMVRSLATFIEDEVARTPVKANGWGNKVGL